MGENDIVNLSNLGKGRVKVWGWKAAKRKFGQDFALPFGICPWLIGRWTEGKQVGRSNRTGGGMALYQTHLKA
jgi:hypothetical protein